MNNLKLMKLLTKTPISYRNYGKSLRVIQHVSARPMSASVSISKNVKDKEVFLDALPGIIESLGANPKLSQAPEMSKWLKKILEHNLRGGKHARGLMTTMAYEMLERPEHLSDETIKQSRVLGWCVEMLQAYFLVLDDVIDGATTRRGVPCWYRMPDVGLNAINDASLVYGCITETIETHFLKTPHYVEIIGLFHEAHLYTAVGQNLDYATAHNNNNNYSLFTIDRYESIVRYKTTCYSFRLPVLLGLVLVRDVDPAVYQAFDNISFKIGLLFQIQDDFIDCYGNELETGKAGNDIQEGKCSWLAVKALQLANNEQRHQFITNYGSKDPQQVSTIKQLYDQLEIPKFYTELENETYHDIVKSIRSLPKETSPDFFYKLIDFNYKRKS